MATGKKTGGRDFVKGQPGGPGAPRIPSDLKEARAQQAVEIESVIYKYMNASIDELKNAYTTKGTPTKELIVIRLLIASIEKSDEKRFEFILNRSIGKVVDKIDHTVDVKPSILVRQDGTEVVFTNKKVKDD